MKKKLHPKLVEKLDATRANYEKVTVFAELMPLFGNEIIEGEHTGETYFKLKDRFGKMYFAWGINWLTNTPTNYPTEKHSQVGFVNVYINAITLFGDDCHHFAHEELGKALPEIQVHFYDNLNSTFYFLPHEAEAGLKRLEQWYLQTKSKCDDYLKTKRKEALQRELEALQ